METSRMNLEPNELRPREAHPRTAESVRAWQEVCALDDIAPSSGVAAWLDGEQVALIRLNASDTVYAIANFDPFSRAYVMARGIVGDRAGIPKIASPIFKQSFNLETGECLDDPGVRLRVYPVMVADAKVFVDVNGAP